MARSVSIATWIALLISIGAMLIHTAVVSKWIPDDIFITYRYAENFSNGNGLVFNAGECTEGYTTFLWTILISLCYKAGLGSREPVFRSDDDLFGNPKFHEDYELRTVPLEGTGEFSFIERKR
ncbi:MAG: hypothetical protein WC505_07400 [Patescibacteria group bacterium]